MVVSIYRMFLFLLLVLASTQASAALVPVNFLSPIAGAVVSSEFVIKGKCDATGDPVVISGDIGNPGKAACLKDNTYIYTVKITASRASGSISVRLQQAIPVTMGGSSYATSFKYKVSTTPTTVPPKPPTPTTTTTLPPAPPKPPTTTTTIPVVTAPPSTPIPPGIPTGPIKAPTEAINLSTARFVSPSGSDANAGTQSQPWKTLQYSVNQLLPGQTLVVRGGRYPEEVVFNRGGLVGQPIRVVAYPGEVPLLDGADAIAGWTKCPSSAACGGVVDFAKVYYAPYTRTAIDGHLVDGDKSLFRAQYPEQPDDFYKESIASFLKPAKATGTKTAIVDPVNLAGVPNLNGAYIYTWTIDNRIAARKILSYDRSAGIINFDLISNIRLTEEYSLFNHLSFLKKPGHYVIDETAKRIYVIPVGSAESVRISMRKNAININGKSNITIDGLKMVGYSGPSINQGLAVLNLVGKVISNLKIQNLVITGNHSEANYGAITIGNCTDCFFLGNRIERNGSRGFQIGRSDRALIQGNFITTIYGSGMFVAGLTNSRIDKNTIVNNNGIHANGIAVYEYSRDCQVTGNYLVNAQYGLAIQASTNIVVERNLLSTSNSRILVNYGGTGDRTANYTIVRYNTVLNSTAHASLFNGANNVGFVAENNILDGYGADPAAVGYTSNNIFLGLAWTQTEKTLGVKEYLYKNGQANFFVDSAKGDYRIKAGTMVNGVDVCKLSTEAKPVGAFGCGP